MSCENCEESAYVIDKLAKLMAEIAIIVNGLPPSNISWSYHDLPEKVRALKQAQQPAALAVPADVARHAAVAVTYLDCSGGMPAGLSLALQRLRDALQDQQPAAAVPAGWAEPGAMTDHEVLTDFVRMCRENKPVGQWPGERVCAAIERSMAREAPFRFISEADRSPEREPSHKDSDRPFSGPSKPAALAVPAGLHEAPPIPMHLREVMPELVWDAAWRTLRNALNEQAQQPAALAVPAARDQLQRDIDRMERLVEAVGDEYDEAAVQRIRAALQALHAAVVLGDLQRDVALVQEAVAEDLREESWEAWQRLRTRLETVPDLEAVPEGYTLVPVEPTEAIIGAGIEAQMSSLFSADDRLSMDDARWRMTRSGYRAMLAAALAERNKEGG